MQDFKSLPLFCAVLVAILIPARADAETEEFIDNVDISSLSEPVEESIRYTRDPNLYLRKLEDFSKSGKYVKVKLGDKALADLKGKFAKLQENNLKKMLALKEKIEKCKSVTQGEKAVRDCKREVWQGLEAVIHEELESIPVWEKDVAAAFEAESAQREALG